LTPAALALLTEQGSLTEHIGKLMGHAPRVHCLRQKHDKPGADVARLLAMPSRHYALVREILMCAETTPWLYARTVIPPQTYRGSIKQLMLGREKPLGSKLFGRFHGHREWLDIDYAPLADRQLAAELGVAGRALWQRRSLFTIDAAPLLVDEIFLPDSPLYYND